jgi:hypothetical protein
LLFIFYDLNNPFLILVKLSGRGSISLVEMVLHVTLKVEVSKLIVLLELEKLRKLGVGMDDTSIALVLKLVCLDVSVNLLAYLSACHLGSDILTEEIGELIADAGRLDETRRLAVTSVSALLGGSLKGSLHLTSNSLLKSLEVILDGREETNKLLKLGAELRKLLGQASSRVNGLGSLSGLRSRSSLNSGCGGRGGGGLLCARLSLSSSLFGSLRCSNHYDYIL